MIEASTIGTTYYTNELRSRFRNCHLIKYADDRVIVGLISNNDESEYNEQISEVVLWCKAHNLLLNAAKTKELIFDFRWCNISHIPLSIDNSIVEICDNFKYLGITFDCKLKWSNHCALIVSKCKQRLFFLRLPSFAVSGAIMWNDLHPQLRTITCLTSFKRELRKTLC